MSVKWTREEFEQAIRSARVKGLSEQVQKSLSLDSNKQMFKFKQIALRLLIADNKVLGSSESFILLDARACQR